jgi:cysteine sulfinate desulfinase/cysteine desulfurase-like protein
MPAYLDHNAASPVRPEAVSRAQPSDLEKERRRHYLSQPGDMVVTLLASIAGSLASNSIRTGFGMDNSLQSVEALYSKLRKLVNRLPANFCRAAV